MEGVEFHLLYADWESNYMPIVICVWIAETAVQNASNTELDNYDDDDPEHAIKQEIEKAQPITWIFRPMSRHESDKKRRGLSIS